MGEEKSMSYEVQPTNYQEHAKMNQGGMKILEGSMIHDIAEELSSNWHAAMLTRHSLQLDIIYVS
jgi:hypothetical protein